MRATSIARLAACGYQWELVEQLATDASGGSAAAFVGTAVHKALEVFNTARIEGRSPTLPDLLAATPREGLGDDDYEDALGMLVAYHPIITTYMPVSAEHHWYVPALDVEGTIDLLTETVGPTTAVINTTLIDYKTGKRAWSQLDADTSLQLSIYAWGLRKTGVWKAGDVDVEIHSLTRLKKTDSKGNRRKPEDVYKAKVIRTKRNLINYEWVDEVFLPRVLRKAGVPNPGTHCAWCPVREHCGYFEGMQMGREDMESEG